MKIIADTSIWSNFLRRKNVKSSAKVEVLRQAIIEKRIQMLGIVRQELLSGIKDEEHFTKISEILNGFPDLLATTEDHHLAAKYHNTCRKNGVQGSSIDFLICAQAHNHKMAILASDNDFMNYSEYIPVVLQ